MPLKTFVLDLKCKSVEIRLITFTLLIVASLYSGDGKAQEAFNLSASALNPDMNPYYQLRTNPKREYLKRTKIVVGSIVSSRHFETNDFNETHNGIYFRIAKWSVGTYKNSSNRQSTFVTYNPKIYSKKGLEVNFVAGVANGYEGWEYTEGGYLPLVGVSAQWMGFRTLLQPGVVAFGVELPLN